MLVLSCLAILGKNKWKKGWNKLGSWEKVRIFALAITLKVFPLNKGADWYAAGFLNESTECSGSENVKGLIFKDCDKYIEILELL